MVSTIEGGSEGVKTEYSTTAEITPEAEKRIEKVSESLTKEVSEKYKGEDSWLRKIMHDTCSKEQVTSLTHGTLNLINIVKERAEEGRQIETMVFLDKSARNGYYMFDKMWRGLVERGELSETLEKPKIRFLNIGRKDDLKHEQDSRLILLKNKIHGEDYKNPENVLIVDEYIQSGGSARKALETVEKLFDGKATAVSQFDLAPSWHVERIQGILGVEDNEVDEQFDENFTKIPTEHLLKIKELDDRLGREKFDALFKSLCNSEYWPPWQESYKRQFNLEKVKEERNIHNISEEDVASLRFLAQTRLDKTVRTEQYQDAQIFTGEFRQFFKRFTKTAGGYITRPMENEEKEHNFLVYRKFLGKIVEKYMITRKGSKETINTLANRTETAKV